VRLTPGVRLGPYEVLSVLGTGGMAEVYRARDTRLGREVALKVVNESLASNPELVRRFEQEARLAGSLNHPNVVAVHDVGLHEGATYFVTELLQGESLRHRLSRGRIPLHTALEWAAQIARGLAAAHGRGVIHRDVKPDNIFISADGQVKLLDFGIAKLTEAVREAGTHDLMDATLTPTGGATRTGSVLGTPGYMSPEQVRGESLDARTDIFSLGAVLYEMLSGQRAFPGATAVESGYAILHTEPEPLPSVVPSAVSQVVFHCLEKEPARRLQSASDLAFDLELLRSPTGSTGPVVRPSRILPRRAAGLVGVAVAVVVALALAFAAGHRQASKPRSLPEVESLTFRWGAIGAARFLPDGRVAFSAAFEGHPEEVFVQPPGSPTPQGLGLQDVRLLAASATGELAVALHPRWAEGVLARVPSVGGTPREMAENVHFADWSPTGGLAVVRRSGNSFVLESPPGKALFQTNGYLSHPRFSGKGDRIAFLHHPVARDTMGEVVVTDLRGKAQTLFPRLPITNGLAWSADDSEVWFTWGRYQEDVLAAVSLGGKTRELYRSLSRIRLEDVGKASQVLVTNLSERLELVYAGEGGGQTLLSWTDWNTSLAALSADGKVLFSTAQTAPISEGQHPAWVMLRKTDGSPAQVLGEGFALDLSADGQWALVGSVDHTKLMALPTGVGQHRSIVSHGLEVLVARWIPRGKEVLVSGRAPGESLYHLYRLAGDGSTPARVGDVALIGPAPLHISPDGHWVLALGEDLKLLVVSLRDGTVFAVPRTGTEVPVPRGWSPEGNLWVTEGGLSAGARARLLRVEPRTGKLLEERSIGPADQGGATGMRDLVLTADGRQVSFTYRRDVGTLAIARGLGR
jgi:eukaryotic-like serine/threonine-protein kinase